MKKKLQVLSLVMVIGLLTACTAQQDAVKGQESSISKDGEIKNVKVVAEKLSIRTGCSNEDPVVQVSDKDTILNVINKVADWYAIRLPNNRIGFVPENQVKPIVVEDKKPQPAPQPTVGTSPGAGTTPGTTATRFGTAIPGTGDTAQGDKTKTPEGTQSNNNALTSDEQEMLRLVNEARIQNNVPPLEVDIELTNVARIKAQDMIENNYFSHNSPKYGSPFDMMKDFGIEYTTAGENIAGNQNMQSAHEALMNSPGHRKNILNPDYTHIGIGIKNGGSYGKMFTQMFIAKPQ